MDSQKIIIDTDPGIDDAMAIHQAFSDTRLRVMGLTTVFGNVPTAIATRNALRLAEMAAYPTPVAHGADKPMKRVPAPPADFVHGREGFGRVPAAEPLQNADPRSACTFLTETIINNPNEICVCAIGPLTNLAMALERCPEITDLAMSVTVMGGTVTRPGNVSEYAEANIWGDPDAAEIVFSANWDVTMIGLDVTEQVQCGPEDFNVIARRSPRIGGFLNDAVDFYLDFHESKNLPRKCYMHDPSAVFSVTDPDLFEFENLPLEVILNGEESGRTRVSKSLNRKTIRVATGVNSTSIQKKFIELLCFADKLADDRRGSIQ
jgi:inosine-uridine nucleoside N-ribohydrolase